MTTSLLLGVDGGGTSTVAWLADGQGKVIGKGIGGPSNVKAVGTELALAALNGAIDQAFRNAQVSRQTVEIACLGLAGFDRPEDRFQLEEWNAQSHWANRLILANDGELIIAAGTPGGWGLGVIAGTGSIAVGRTREGKVSRAGGWGPLLGDEGSGYAVALSGLRMVVRRVDGRLPAPSTSVLADRLCRALDIKDPSQLIATLYSPSCDRTRIAALASEVVKAGELDAQVRTEILEPAGRELAEAVAAVARSLGWTNGPIPLGMAGGFILSSQVVSDSLLDHLRGLGYQPTTTRVDQPVLGAVMIALRHWQQQDTNGQEA